MVPKKHHAEQSSVDLLTQSFVQRRLYFFQINLYICPGARFLRSKGSILIAWFIRPTVKKLNYIKFWRRNSKLIHYSDQWHNIPYSFCIWQRPFTVVPFEKQIFTYLCTYLFMYIHILQLTSFHLIMSSCEPKVRQRIELLMDQMFIWPQSHLTPSASDLWNLIQTTQPKTLIADTREGHMCNPNR